MRPHVLTLAAGVLLSATAALAAADPGRAEAPAGRSLSCHEGARVTLSLDKKEYFLGENILLHYCLENASTTPFPIQSDMDMDSPSRRQSSFTVIAQGDDGKAVEDPCHAECGTGPGLDASAVLKPGEKHCESLQLIRFCRFEKPGVYTIRVVRDLGWRLTGQQKFPAGQIKIKLVMPTPEQARRVVETMYKLPKKPGAGMGQTWAPFADFGALCHPVYLPILREHLERADADALAAVAEMPTPESTEAIIALLAHPNRGFAVEAALRLVERLPDAKESVWARPFADEEQWLVSRAWRPEFTPRVLAHARTFLASRDDEALTVAAAIVRSLGGKGDLAPVVAALDDAVPRSHGLWREVASCPVLTGPCPELLEAAEVLAVRGAPIPGDPRSPGQKVAFLAALGRKAGFRPKGWEAVAATLIKDRELFIRQTAILSAPRPLPKPLLALLPTLIADPSPIISIAACTVATQTKAPELRQPILDVLANASSGHHLSIARDAAFAQGIPVEALDALASRIANTEIGWICFRLVATAVVQSSGDGFVQGASSEKVAVDTRTRWQKFLKRHREAIRAGRKFKPGDPELAPDLIPPHFRFTLPDGRQWP